MNKETKQQSTSNNNISRKNNNNNQKNYITTIKTTIFIATRKIQNVEHKEKKNYENTQT